MRWLDFTLNNMTLLALTLAGIGLHGLLSFMVTTRVRDIGVRHDRGIARLRHRRFLPLAGIRVPVIDPDLVPEDQGPAQPAAPGDQADAGRLRQECPDARLERRLISEEPTRTDQRQRRDVDE